jgi:hypothetical protein
MAYETTDVPAMQSYGEIVALLAMHGCDSTRHTEQPDGFILEFVRPINNGRVLVKIPVRYELTPKKHSNRLSPTPLTKCQIEQEKRTKWRGLYFYLKGVFDAVDKHIVMFEQAFLADTVMALPNGRSGRLIELMPGAHIGEIIDSQFLLEEPAVEYRKLPDGGKS